MKYSPKVTDLAIQAQTERGATIQYTDEEVNLALKLLAINGGAPATTQLQLADEGWKISRNTLKAWRDNQFARRYAETRRSMGKEISEKIAGQAMERALQADEAQQLYLQAAIDKVNEVDANHLAKNVASLSQAKATEIEKARLLRNEPDSIQETRTLEENVAVLERLEVAEQTEKRPADFDGEAEEE